MKARNVGWFDPDEKIVQIDIYEWEDSSGAIDRAERLHEQHKKIEIVEFEDGSWKVYSGTDQPTKTYTTKDTLMVALALKGIDVSELEKVNAS